MTNRGFAIAARRYGEIIVGIQPARGYNIDPKETYHDFILRCAQNEIARQVKLADLADNLDFARLGREPNAKDNERRRKYLNAAAVLRQNS